MSIGNFRGNKIFYIGFLFFFEQIFSSVVFIFVIINSVIFYDCLRGLLLADII